MPALTYCPQCKKPLAEREDGGRPRLVCPDAACGYVYYDNPVPVVAALVEHEGDIILTQSKGWPADWFGLVAGFLENGETPEDGVLREVEEELGLQGEIVERIGIYSFFRKNQLILAYHVRAEGDVVLGDELAAVKRVPPEKLEPWPYGTGDAVRDWLARRGDGSVGSMGGVGRGVAEREGKNR
ncbi:MAG: NUDIX domain-containing protein [Rhodothermales bacterium]